MGILTTSISASDYISYISLDHRYPLNCRKHEQKMSTGDKLFMNVLLRFLYISANILSVTLDCRCILILFVISIVKSIFRNKNCSH